MVKTSNEDYQRELYQLFAQAGETQFTLQIFRDTIAKKSSELNTINQKIERLQVEFRNFIDRKVSDKVSEAPVSEEAANAPTTENV